MALVRKLRADLARTDRTRSTPPGEEPAGRSGSAMDVVADNGCADEPPAYRAPTRERRSRCRWSVERGRTAASREESCRHDPEQPSFPANASERERRRTPAHRLPDRRRPAVRACRLGADRRRRPGRRVAPLRRRRGEHALLAARPDRRGQLRGARAGVAAQDRQLRSRARVQLPVHAPDGRRGRLHHRGHPPGGGRGRRRHRRVPVDAPPRRGRAGRGGAPPPVGARALLPGRWRRRADHLRHARLPHGRAERGDGAAHRGLRRGRHRGPDAEHGPGDRPPRGLHRPALHAAGGR